MRFGMPFFDLSHGQCRDAYDDMIVQRKVGHHGAHPPGVPAVLSYAMRCGLIWAFLPQEGGTYPS
jgi:hypothetical protein